MGTAKTAVGFSLLRLGAVVDVVIDINGRVNLMCLFVHNCTMPYHDLGTPSQSAVTHHNALCLVPDSDSAQYAVQIALKIKSTYPHVL